MPPAHLLDEGDQYWLGIALWKPVLDRLHNVIPADGDLARQWPLFLEVISAWDDLGGLALNWDAVLGPDSPLALRRLVDRLAPKADLAFRAALAKRALPKTNPHRLLKTKTTGSKKATSPRDSWAGLTLIVPASSNEPRVFVTVKRDSRRKGLSISTEVFPWDEDNAASQRLKRKRPGKPPYRRNRDGWVQRQVLERSAAREDVERLLEAVIEAELVHIVQSGILDLPIAAAR